MYTRYYIGQEVVVDINLHEDPSTDFIIDADSWDYDGETGIVEEIMETRKQYQKKKYLCC